MIESKISDKEMSEYLLIKNSPNVMHFLKAVKNLEQRWQCLQLCLIEAIVFEDTAQKLFSLRQVDPLQVL